MYEYIYKHIYLLIIPFSFSKMCLFMLKQQVPHSLKINSQIIPDKLRDHGFGHVTLNFDN